MEPVFTQDAVSWRFDSLSGQARERFGVVAFTAAMVLFSLILWAAATGWLPEWHPAAVLVLIALNLAVSVWRAKHPPTLIAGPTGITLRDVRPFRRQRWYPWSSLRGASVGYGAVLLEIDGAWVHVLSSTASLASLRAVAAALNEMRAVYATPPPPEPAALRATRAQAVLR